MKADKAVLLHPGYQGQIPPGYSSLKPDWFSHNLSITEVSGIQSETIKTIKTFGILEKIETLRDCLKKLDYLLSPEGTLEIQFYTVGDLYSGGHYIRPLSFLLHEISLSLGSRYLLEKKKTEGEITELVYRKKESALAAGDSIKRWTFGIVSDGRKDDRINAIIDQIRKFNIPHYEVIICGPQPKFICGTDTKVFSDADLYHDIRIPITSKKNRIIQNASYDNVVIMHDRISFPDNWFQVMTQFGNCFEILCSKVLDEETHTHRVQDWMSYNQDFNSYTRVETGYLKYSEWKPTVYVDGGFIIAKRNVLKAINGYNEALKWGEAEDVDLSIRLYDAGYNTNFVINNEIYTQTHRHKGSLEKKGLTDGLLVRKAISAIKYRLRMKKQKGEFLRFVNKTNIGLD